jgi:hypothetical protein
MPKSIQMPPRLSISKNVQVSYSGSVHHARSESVVSINPTDGQNLIAAPFSVTMGWSVQSLEAPNAVFVIDSVRRAAMNPAARAQHSDRVRVPAGGVDER